MEVVRYISAEFLNRLDEIIRPPLASSQWADRRDPGRPAQAIARNRKINLELTAGARARARSQGYDPVTGARRSSAPCKSICRTFGDKILAGEIPEGSMGGSMKAEGSPRCDAGLRRRRAALRRGAHKRKGPLRQSVGAALL